MQLSNNKTQLKVMKQIPLIIVALLISQSVFAGGPWPQKKGGLYLKLSEWWTIFDEHFSDSGQIDPNQTIGIFNTTIYAEYGITDRLTAIVNAPILTRNTVNNIVSSTTQEIIFPGDAINTFGDTNVSIKYGITKPGAKIPVAATILFGLPFGTPIAGEQKNLQTGDGEFNQMIRIDAGTGFNITEGINGYVSAFGGFNNRTNGFSEEVRYGAEIGLGLINSKLWINGRLNVVESLANEDSVQTNTSTSIFANNSESTSLGVEANFYITPEFGVSAGFANPVRGEIIAAASSYSLGIFLDLK